MVHFASHDVDAFANLNNSTRSLRGRQTPVPRTVERVDTAVAQRDVRALCIVRTYDGKVIWNPDSELLVDVGQVDEGAGVAVNLAHEIAVESMCEARERCHRAE